ncbi:MAG: M16 family metallopeptidase [Flavobacteriales bacterium]
MEYNLYELSNGIRIVHKPISGKIAHCGFIINTGSRDENINENGIAHFIEHTIFKGTQKRKAHHILNRIDSVGGEINAYTTKEKTCVYASFVVDYLERATELLTDIITNSTFPEKEIEKEKDVVIDEIHSYQDTPYEQIYDDFEEMVFRNHSLGKNILGTVKSVKKFNRKSILDFIDRNYATNQIVFSIIGNISEKKIKQLSKKYLGLIPSKTNPLVRTDFTDYKPFQTTIKKDNYQSHSILGNIAYGANDNKKPGFILLNNYLGGPAMNSRLNMSIREKHGFAYSVESSYTSYTNTGIFSVYLGTDQKNMSKSIELTLKELKLLREKRFSDIQLHRAKVQLLGQITLSEENNVNIMLGIGKSLLNYGKVDSLEDVYKKINNITAEQLLEIANDIFNKEEISTLIYQSKK